MVRQHPLWQYAFIQAHNFWLQARSFKPGDLYDQDAVRAYATAMADLAIRGLLDAQNVVDATDKDAFERGVQSVKARFDLISSQFTKVQEERDQLRKKLTAPEGCVSCYVSFVDGVPATCVGIEAEITPAAKPSV